MYRPYRADRFPAGHEFAFKTPCRFGTDERASVIHSLHNGMCQSPGLPARNAPQRQQTARQVIVKLGNPNGITAEQIFDHVEREVASLQMDYFRWRPDSDDHRDEIRVRCNHRAVMIPCPLPNLTIIGLLQTDISHVNAPRKQG